MAHVFGFIFSWGAEGLSATRIRQASASLPKRIGNYHQSEHNCFLTCKTLWAEVKVGGRLPWEVALMCFRYVAHGYWQGTAG
jgi:hypothetical protein